jgi:hypothetical protein
VDGDLGSLGGGCGFVVGGWFRYEYHGFQICQKSLCSLNGSHGWNMGWTC